MRLVATAPTFTRPNDTTAYAATGDLVANSTTAANVTALQFKQSISFMPWKQWAIREVIISASGTTITSKALRLHLFTAIPTFVTGGDNSAISTVVATGAASWIGALDVTAMQAVADGSFGCGAPIFGSEVVWSSFTAPDAAGDMTLYGCLEARGAFTPAAQETFTVTIAGLPVAH